jgi:hypothetical protein
MRGVIPEWKPMITEYSQFRSGNRSTTYLSPRSERLSIAEAATFGGSFAHDMEGPFDDALIHGNKAAMASWNAIGVYNRFLARHRDIYHDATQVANYLVLLPGTGMSFDWREEKNDLYDVLAKKSVLFSLMLVGRVHEADLAKYKTVVIPKGVPWPDDLRNYKKRGGHVDVVDGAPKGPIGTMLKEPPACASLSIDSGRNVLGNITRIDAGKSLAIHILNYAATPDADVRIGVELGPDCENTIQGALQVFSPDAAQGSGSPALRSQVELRPFQGRYLCGSRSSVKDWNRARHIFATGPRAAQLEENNVKYGNFNQERRHEKRNLKARCFAMDAAGGCRNSD